MDRERFDGWFSEGVRVAKPAPRFGSSAYEYLLHWGSSLDVPEQGLDPCLVLRDAGTAELAGDGHPGEELPGAVGGHLRPVVADRQQQGPVPAGDDLGDGLLPPVGQGPDQIVGGGRIGAGPQVLGFQRLGEGDLDLGRGLLGRAHSGHPLTRDDIDDRDRRPLRPGEVAEIVGPDPIRDLLQPVRPRLARDGLPGRIPGQYQALSVQHPLDRRG